MQNEMASSGNEKSKSDNKKPKIVFPKTLQEFRYHFKDGRLCNIDSGEGFKFVVHDDNHSYNQMHYEAIGEVITDHVYGLLESECDLKRLPVPAVGEEEDDDQARGFFFVSDNWATSEKLMVLIHGSGVVRAGQWARRLIINDCLNSGTQIPFIKRALREGYGVLVMNSNQNYALDAGGKEMLIKSSENPTKHAVYIWKQYINSAQAKHIAIVAHSYGGVVTTDLYYKLKECDGFMNRMFAVAFTDSVHFIRDCDEAHEFLEMTRNWVTSHLPLDEPIEQRTQDVPCVSAGVGSHEMTSWSSFRSIFRFFRERLQQKTDQEIPEIPEDEYPELVTQDNLSALGKASTMPVAGQASGSQSTDTKSNDEVLPKEASLPATAMKFQTTSIDNNSSDSKPVSDQLSSELEGATNTTEEPENSVAEPLPTENQAAGESENGH